MTEKLKNIFLKLMARYSDNELFNLECWEEIEKQYSQKSRYYHNLSHLNAMIKQMSLIKDLVDAPDEMLFAIFYHDIIYKSSRKDNEHQSAFLFQKRIKETNFKNIDHVIDQIVATKFHKLSVLNDTNLFLDIDMSILGQPSKVYNEYVSAVRKEYRMYPDFLYKPGRAKVLKSFLESQVFKTSYFENKYEMLAQENITLELKSLLQ